MVSPTGAVYTLSKQHQTVRPAKGTGTMEITDNKIFLNTGNERIEIEPPVPSNIRNGTAVKYSLHEQTVHLTVAHPSEIQEMVDDAPAGNRHTETIASTTFKSMPPLTPGTSLPEGMYTFSSVEELSSFLKTAISVEMLRQIETIIASEGTVALQITREEDGNNLAYVLRPSELAYSLEKLRATFQSPLLTVIPPVVLKKLLSGHGALPFASLRQIDDLLDAAPHLFPPARSGSAEAQNQAITQWLNTALDTQVPLNALVRRTPVYSLSTLLTDIENTRQSSSDTLHSVLLSLPTSETFLADRPDSPAATRDWLQQIIEQLGFTFENDIKNITTEKSATFPGASLKKILLQLSASELNAVSSDAPAEAPVHDNAPSDGLTEQMQMIPDTARLREHLQVTKRSILSLLKQQLPEVHHQLLRPGDSSTSPLLHEQNAVAGQSAPTEDLSGPHTVKTVQIITAFLKSAILSPLFKSPSVQAFSGSDADAFTKVLATLQEITNELDSRMSSAATENRVQTGSAGSESSPAAGITTPDPAATGSLIPLLRKSLDALNTLTDFFLQTGTTTRTDQPENGSTAKAGTDADGKPEIHTLDSTLSDTSTTVRKMFQSPLEAFESLQLLARQTPVSQGTQQIISLPVNVDGQWTEVNIRVVRGKKRNRQRTAPHYSVVLSVAPEATGAITVHLDYRQKRPINIAVDFERNRTRTWFTRHRDAIQQALSVAGISVGSFEFRKTHTSPEDNRTATGSGTGRNMIDMKV